MLKIFQNLSGKVSDVVHKQHLMQVDLGMLLRKNGNGTPTAEPNISVPSKTEPKTPLWPAEEDMKIRTTSSKASRQIKHTSFATNSDASIVHFSSDEEIQTMEKKSGLREAFTRPKKKELMVSDPEPKSGGS